MTIDWQALLKDYGPAMCLLGYFVYKDWKFTARITELMAKIEEYLETQATKAAKAT